MSLKRRKAFLKLAVKYKLPVVEDDPYGYLRFTGRPQPSLYSLAKGRGVIYLSTFSKILSPGIRLGFVVAEPHIIQELVLAKQAADLQPNSLIQRAAYYYGKNGHLDRHIPTITQSYQKRADIMLAAMRRHFPPTLRWIAPEGGMFIWCTLPKGMSSTKLFKKAVGAGDDEAGGDPEEEALAEDAPDIAAVGGGDLGAAPAGGHLKVELDRLVRPGAVVSGSVTFSDGVTSKWAMDQYGRLVLDTGKKGYQPSAADVQAFQRELNQQLQRHGY